jgi:Zn-dependent protease
LLRFDLIALNAPGFLLAITVHEFAHAYVAFRYGDPTAKDMGRLTLNPLPHLDLFGTIALFLIGFGWAKPVMVNPHNLKNPRKDNLWIALGGPVSNLITAFILGMLFRALGLFLPNTNTAQICMLMVVMAVRLNIILAAFNILPLPPLDGFHVLEGLVSNDVYLRLQNFGRYGSMVLLGLVLISSFANINIFGFLFNPFLAFFGGIFTGHNLAF